MALSATGVGSGLDIEGLIGQLMAAERIPVEQRLIKRETKITEDISALGSLKGALSAFQSTLSSVNAIDTYEKRNASSSNASAVIVTATSDAAVGTYNLNVSSLANAQSLAVRNQFSSVNETVGTGTLTFTFGTTSYTADTSTPVNTVNDTYDGFVAKAGAASKTVTIDSTNNTLSGVRDAINAADFGVSAAIVNDGSSFRLLLSSNSTGAENSLQISVSDSGDSNDTDQSGLSRLAFNTSAGTTNVYQTTAASDAAFTINGLSLTSTGNTVTDAVTGLTLTLKETTSSAEISVTDNQSGIKQAINTFVSGYNDLITTLNELTSYDAATGARGALQGDFSARSIFSQLRSTLGNAADGYKGALSRLPEIGITSTTTGTLAVDDAKLTSALESNFDDVAGVLAHFAQPAARIGIKVADFTETTVKGEYTVGVTSLATSGKMAANVPSAGFPKTIGSGTDGLVATIDGKASSTITLSNQAYANLAAMATELQTKINADATLRAAGKAVTVSVSGDDIEIRSNSLGSSSTVALVNAGTDTTLTTLGLASATTTNGTDLVGTIDGVAGVASGNTLTGAVGTTASGLSLDISSTTGGTVTVSYGVVDQLDTWLASLLGDDNVLDSRITSLNARVSEIADERTAAERRFDAIEKRYRAQFNALDSLLNELNSTGSFISDQLANIPLPGKSKK